KNVWFTEINASKIGRITTSGTVTEFAIKTPTGRPYGITTGPDGRLWFGEEASKIGVMSTTGTTSEFTTPTSTIVTFITPGPDGTLWFNEFNANNVGRVSTSGDFLETPIPTAASFPFGIVFGSDHQLWLAELNGNKIGRVQTSTFSASFN